MALYKPFNPGDNVICIGPQSGGRCADPAMRFIAGGQIIKYPYFGVMSGANFPELKTNIKPNYFLQTLGGGGLSPLQLFNLPPGVYIFLTYYVPDRAHPSDRHPHFAAINTFKRVAYAGHGDMSFLDDRDCSNKKAAAKVFAELRLREVREACQLMVLA